MQIALIILSAGLLGVIIFFAVSPKSSRLLRLVSFGALVLIALSVGVCSVFLIRGPVEDPAAAAVPVFLEEAQPARKSNTPALIGFISVFALVLGFIMFIALKGQNKDAGAANKPGRPLSARGKEPRGNGEGNPA